MMINSKKAPPKKYIKALSNFAKPKDATCDSYSLGFPLFSWLGLDYGILYEIHLKTVYYPSW